MEREDTSLTGKIIGICEAVGERYGYSESIT